MATTHPQPWQLRRRELGLALLTVLLGLTIAILSFVAQSHYQSLYLDGERLSGWENFLRVGAPWQALVPVAAAAVLASIGGLRLPSSSPEPAIGRTDRELTVSQLRGQLRRERRAVEIAVTVISALASIVAIRLAVYAVLAVSGDALARSTVAGILAELIVWCLAWLSFWGWQRRHRVQLERWGVRR